MRTFAARGHRARRAFDTPSPCPTSNALGAAAPDYVCAVRLLSFSKNARTRRCGDAGGQGARYTMGHRSPRPPTPTRVSGPSGGPSPSQARGQERRSPLRSSLAPSLIQRSDGPCTAGSHVARLPGCSFRLRKPSAGLPSLRAEADRGMGPVGDARPGVAPSSREGLVRRAR